MKCSILENEDGVRLLDLSIARGMQNGRPLRERCKALSAIAIQLEKALVRRQGLLREVRNDLLSGTRSFRSAAFHEPLKTVRAVFAGEVAIALAHAFKPREGSVLAYLPAGVTAE